MLVISRKASESVFLGDDIEIIVSEIVADKVKLCIRAPRAVSIMRGELLETGRLNQEASRLPGTDALGQLKRLLK